MVIPQQDLEIITYDGLKLHAALTAPSTPRAAVLLISGGGNVGASGDVSSPFIGSGYHGQPAPLNEQLAFAFLEAGIASLRYDKRGFADPAQIPTQTLPNLLSDAKTALNRLQESVPGVPLWLLGFSEGALVAADLAARENVAGLFLLAPPTRPYPEALRYQFVDWPLQVLKRLDPGTPGWITRASLFTADVPHLPLGDLDKPLIQFGIQLPPIHVEHLPFDENGRLSFESIARIYETRFTRISALLQAPFMKALYESYIALPPFSETAGAVDAPTHVYIGGKDSQISPEWMIEGARGFRNLAAVSIFEDYGHSFAPMQGTIGQIKTSGPLAADMIQRILNDAANLLASKGERRE